jgi:hypothetical protein
MWPIPYTGLQAVHDQKIEEALERSRFSTEPARPKRGLRQIFSVFLARFTNFAARKAERKSETTIPTV